MNEISKIKKAETDKLLIVSIFHYLLAGFQMLFCAVGLVYLFFGVLIASGTLEPSKGAGAPPEAMGWIFGVLGVIFVIIFFTMSILTLVTGINISKRRNHIFCIVIDSILCLWVPFGTLVGVFGLVLLTRPEIAVKFLGHKETIFKFEGQKGV